MFKVECPGCKAPYQVDERRIPPNGLKMRCPKCGASFNVDPPLDPQQTGPNPVLDAAFGVGADSIPPPAVASRRAAALKSTMLGMAPGRASPPRPAEGKLAPASSEDPDLPSPAPEVGLPAAAPRKPGGPPRVPPPAPSRAAVPLDADPGADLPARPANPPKPSPSKKIAPPQGIDLPSLPGQGKGSAAPPSARAFGEIEIDLPSPVPPSIPPPGPGSAAIEDLPAPAGVGFPEVRAETQPPLDLPEIAPELPAPRSVDLPDLGGAGLPGVGKPDLPTARGSGLLPGGSERPGSGGSMPELDLGSDFNRGGAERGMGSFGELDLPLITGPTPASGPPKSEVDPLEVDPFGEAVLSLPPSLNPPAKRSSTPSIDTSAAVGLEQGATLVREQGGGTSYGEVNLSPSGAEMPLEEAPPRQSLRSEDDMEFGGVPQGDSAKPRAKVHVSVPAALGTSARLRSDRGRSLLKLFVPLFLIVVAGAALALVPALGPFGAYWLLDRIRAGETQELVESTVNRARKRLQADTFSEAQTAWKEVEAVRAGAKRVRALAAYSSHLGFARELRFGPDSEANAKAKVLLDELEGQGEVAHANLARAARAATQGQLARARQLLVVPLGRSPADPEALALKGEVELRAKEANAALDAWTRLGKLESSARAAFGLARARFAAGDLVGAERDAELAIAKNPAHLGARILIARIFASTREREPGAVESLTQITQSKQASPNELVLAQTMLGDIHLARSRISRAEAAYTAALKLDPKAARALVGLGEALYRAGRYSEAQARFEAGSQAEPDDVLAKIGIGKSKMMLERLDEAHASLKKLRESHPESVSGAYWYGRVLEALGNREEAERVYRSAIDRAPSEPSLVDTYIALALLQTQQGRVEDATKTLSAARERLPKSSAIHGALGDVALASGRYSEAHAEFRRAIALDAEDLGARFKFGVALRRDGKFDEALRAFEEVKAVDRDYPGLALEHGLLYETSGRMEEALRAYEGALAKAPNDPDLMLRVGCGYASAGRTKEAQELLRKVLALRPTSTETNHCLGRALLSEGSRLADALRYLDRAVEFDPHRAEYHLYVGWAANEAGNVPKAERALDQAIRLDQSLADAYWQRGVLRSRQGAVRDAIADLNRALQLRPSRHEVHAALADAYYDFGKEALALAEWRKAVNAQPDNATWRFRYGKLLAANQRGDAARTELATALALAEKSPKGERWLWEGHHLLARAIGLKPEAVRHWEQFLKLGPLDSPYRPEAYAALQKLGRPWTGN